MRKYEGPLFWFAHSKYPQYVIAAATMDEARQRAASWDAPYEECGEVTGSGDGMPPGPWVYLYGDPAPITRKLFASRAEGDRYVIPAQSEAEADGVMRQLAEQEGMLGFDPCSLIDSLDFHGVTIWLVPD
jgi:hypothetical protein